MRLKLGRGWSALQLRRVKVKFQAYLDVIDVGFRASSGLYHRAKITLIGKDCIKHNADFAQRTFTTLLAHEFIDLERFRLRVSNFISDPEMQISLIQHSRGLIVATLLCDYTFAEIFYIHSKWNSNREKQSDTKMYSSHRVWVHYKLVQSNSSAKFKNRKNPADC